MTNTTETAPADAAAVSPQTQVKPRRKVLRWFSPRNIGAVYVWIAIIVLFSLLAPEQFPTWQTAKSVLNQYSVTGIVALSLVVPLSAGYYDLSIGAIVSLTGVFAAYMLEHTSLSAIEVGILAMLLCVVIGLVNAFVVDALKVDSFIGTLGTGAILGSITIALSNDQSISGRIGDSFTNLASKNWDGITLPVLYLLVIVVLLGWWLERTRSGRHIYATGYDRETARLTGIRVHRVTAIAFLTSAIIAGFAGIVLAARISAGSPDSGASYLIPSFSAAFLGATQFRGGRFNPWGVLVAVLLVGTGDIGLIISGGPIWAPQMFEGVVLIAAVSLSGPGREALQTWVKRVRGRRLAHAIENEES
jgi:ribose transport system permease protein